MAQPLELSRPADRPDRLMAISGNRKQPCIAEYSADGGRTWKPATMYTGRTVDDWRTCGYEIWNHGVREGLMPPGNQPCVWNYFFDLAMPANRVALRLKSADDGSVVWEQAVDLGDTGDVFVVDCRNAARLAGGKLPAPWQIKPGTTPLPVESINCEPDVSAPPLVLDPQIKGWYRIYVGMEPCSAFLLYLSGEDIRYSIPDYQGESGPEDRLCREFYIKSADLTGRKICLAPGGARRWREVSVRYIRLVSMSDKEVEDHQKVRQLAETGGRPFAAYMEQCTPAFYEAETLSLRDHTRNDMRLNRDRGATEVYVHVVRIGSKAWYHSDIIERLSSNDEMGNAGWLKFAAWMEQGDPLAVALEEVQAVGLKAFPDLGMNVTYITSASHYAGLAERISREHPELLIPESTMFLDYRKQDVRAYAASIARELMLKYNVPGINLDFARFAHNRAFDEASLVDAVRRIHEARLEAQARWGHTIVIATRIPSYLYKRQPGWEYYHGNYPEFVSALGIWAKNGWIDRVMVCCMAPDDLIDLSLERYKTAIAGTQVELWGDLYGGLEGRRPRSYYLDVARKWIAEGLDGGFFIYNRTRPTDCERLDWQLRLVDMPNVIVEP